MLAASGVFAKYVEGLEKLADRYNLNALGRVDSNSVDDGEMKSTITADDDDPAVATDSDRHARIGPNTFIKNLSNIMKGMLNSLCCLKVCGKYV